MTRTREIDPLSPDEMLLEEFLRPMGLSQYRYALRAGDPTLPCCASADHERVIRWWPYVPFISG